MSMLAYLVKTGGLQFPGNLSRPPGLGREREKSALEQPFKSARTSSRSLLFRCWRRATALTAFAAALTAWTPGAHATIGAWPDTFRARYPGFGHSDWPDPNRFDYTFDQIASVIDDSRKQ
jgi:hypothetical protein